MATLLLEVAVRAALIAFGTAFILWTFRIRAAAVRHAAWTSVVFAMLLLPIWSVAGPRISLAVLPTSAALLDSGSGAGPDPGKVALRPSVTQSGATPVAKAAPTVNGLPLIGAYLLGALALLVRLVFGTVQAHRLRRGAALQAGRATSARCATPITVGWLSPVLILPEGWERWSAAQLDAVLTHEREHARRHDPLVQWLALLNRAIFWFHPLSWWLERRLANLAEEACDAAVIRKGHSPQDYSDYLIDMARALSRQRRRLNVVGMAMHGGGLPDRMRRIFEEGPMKPLPRTRVICALTFCTTSAIVFAAGTLAPRSSAPADSPATAGAPVESGGVSVEPNPTAPVPQPPEDHLGVPPARANAQSPAVAGPPRPDSAKPARSGPPARVSAADFSGNWSLVSATSRGARGGADGGGYKVYDSEVNVMSKWVSGAPVNCGPECAIVQTATTITIRRSVNPEDGWVPDNGEVVLNLDGSDSTVNHPTAAGNYVVHANWDGDKLVVTKVTTFPAVYPPSTVTQVLSIEDGKLKVVTDTGVGHAPVTFTYLKG